LYGKIEKINKKDIFLFIYFFYFLIFINNKMAIRKYTKKSRKYKRKHKSLKLQKGGNGNTINNTYHQPESRFNNFRSERQKELLKKLKLTYDEYVELYEPDRDLYDQPSIHGAYGNPVYEPDAPYLRRKINPRY
jgi:hypothetical protein